MIAFERESHRNAGDGCDFACSMLMTDWESFRFHRDTDHGLVPRPGKFVWMNRLKEGFEGEIEEAAKRILPSRIARVEASIYAYPEDMEPLDEEDCGFLKKGEVTWVGKDAVVVWRMASSW